MGTIIRKALVTGLLSLAASLAISFTLVPMLGGRVEGAGLIMTILCPLVISIPASAVHYHHLEKLRAAQAATARALEELAAANATLRILARTDGLTGLLNRRTFHEELAVYSRSGRMGGLLQLDLDHFKSVNDTHGHAAGDLVLERVGRMLRAQCGPEDLAGRVGGEEFALFKMGLNEDAVFDWCEDLRLSLSALEIRAPSGALLRMSASLGAVHCPPGFNPGASLITADKNLYLAKSRGRDKVVA
ncbi:GGDEF domain-containing protein [Rhizobium rhizosphaerae]|uniref:diguanylate cyclase n=1 Tax=Xaviernesmea rhizosphaerae TaxID=1672749 RepID=A0ABX3PCU4_9HYPH|nr:GGDEF domain-containing protein [Xaviernesmea rhizosphaerae]OQP85818.1 GGDEF domain-containing protein [Xaviernesmea rhizosphaerae]